VLHWREWERAAPRVRDLTLIILPLISAAARKPAADFLQREDIRHCPPPQTKIISFQN